MPCRSPPNRPSSTGDHQDISAEFRGRDSFRFDGPTTETGLITAAGSMLGTPCYMSPEQSFGEKPVDYRTDIWSLGVILYECLTGARPVEGDSIGQVVKRLICDAITPISVVMPSLPADMTALIDCMLAREPEQRPHDLSEVSAVLRRHTTARAPLSHGSGRSSSAPISPPSKRWKRAATSKRAEHRLH